MDLNALLGCVTTKAGQFFKQHNKKDQCWAGSQYSETVLKGQMARTENEKNSDSVLQGEK